MSGNSTSIQSFTHMPVDLCTHMSTCTRSHMPRNVSVHMSVHMSPRITSDVYPELPTSEIFCRHVDNFYRHSCRHACRHTCGHATGRHANEYACDYAFRRILNTCLKHRRVLRHVHVSAVIMLQTSSVSVSQATCTFMPRDVHERMFAQSPVDRCSDQRTRARRSKTTELARGVDAGEGIAQFLPRCNFVLLHSTAGTRFEFLAITFLMLASTEAH